MKCPHYSSTLFPTYLHPSRATRRLKFSNKRHIHILTQILTILDARFSTTNLTIPNLITYILATY